MKKLRSRRGETLVESLVSILIIALSSAMFATMVTTAVNINLKTETATAEFYEEFAAAEDTNATPESATITLNGIGISGSVQVDLYKADNGALASYRKGGS